MAQVIKRSKRGMPKILAGTTTDGLRFDIDNLTIVLAPHELAKIMLNLPAMKLGLTPEEGREWLHLTCKILKEQDK